MSSYEGNGELAAALDDFDDQVIINPLYYEESKFRPSLEERLESIISGAALMADSSCTRDERRERIVAECNAVRQALQELLSEYMVNAGNKPTPQLDAAIETMCKKTRDLRRQLRKAVVDHVSDSFLESATPLMMLVDSALAGDERAVNDNSAIFTEHANKLVEVQSCNKDSSKNLGEGPLILDP